MNDASASAIGYAKEALAALQALIQIWEADRTFIDLPLMRRLRTELTDPDPAVHTLAIEEARALTKRWRAAHLG